MRLSQPRLTILGVSALPLIIGTLLALFILDTATIGDILLINTQPVTIEELIIQTGVSVGLGTLIVFSLFYAIERRGPGARRTIVALVVSPILTASFFLLGQSLLFILFKGTSTSIIPSILSFASLGVLLMSFVFIMMDSVPPMLKNIFVAFYGSVFGTFLGVMSITASMFVLVIVVVMEDYFLTRYSPAAQSVMLIDTPGDDPFDYTRIQTRSAAVGAGDFIAFSLIAAHSFIFFPIYVWAMSIGLAIVGIAINATVLARENQILPGIPLPALLSLVPWIVHVIAYPLLIG
ncbi:MAG: hypothetical protein OEV85_05060 [Candidatus Thorarchaeota archaeon]|nr:hypothetical protein [Candidatus Thorarchaeota archaeon]